LQTAANFNLDLSAKPAQPSLLLWVDLNLTVVRLLTLGTVYMRASSPRNNLLRSARIGRAVSPPDTVQFNFPTCNAA
jgi:hypothetical protein